MVRWRAPGAGRPTSFIGGHVRAFLAYATALLLAGVVMASTSFSTQVATAASEGTAQEFQDSPITIDLSRRLQGDEVDCVTYLENSPPSGNYVLSVIGRIATDDGLRHIVGVQQRVAGVGDSVAAHRC